MKKKKQAGGQKKTIQNVEKLAKISAFVRKVAKLYNPEKIILFGSYAYGKPRPESDVDILVIMSFEGKGFRKSLEILERTDPDFSIELLARLPEDTERRYREGDPLIRMALDQGKVLYERNC